MVAYTVTRGQWDTRSRLIELDVAPHLINRQQQLISVSQDPEYFFRSQLAISTGTFNLIQSPIKAVQYSLLNENRSVQLSPLLLNKDIIESELYHFRINFPDEILSNNCLVINQFNINEDDHSIIIDSITKTGLLITCVLKVSDFIAPSVTSSHNYQDWCKISNPYGFDIRKPHILHSIDYNYLMVFLKDGGLIGLTRSLETDLFNSIEPIIFNDSSYLQSIKSLLKPWNRIIINDDAELSVNTVIDVITFENFLITITIDKKLRVWSILNKGLLFEKPLEELFNVDNSNVAQFLASNPTKLLDILKVSGNKSYLTIFSPLQGGIFKIYNIENSHNEENFQLIDLGLSISTALPDISSAFKIVDFKTIKISDEFGLWVLWKSGQHSIVKKLSIKEDFSMEEWIPVNSHLSLEKSNDFKLSFKETWTEYFLHKIFQSGNYSDLIIETALKIFQKHFHLKFSSGSLVDDVSKTITVSSQKDDIDSISSLEIQWRKFDALCQDFKKQSEDSLKLLQYNEDLFLVNRDSISLIRQENSLEALSNEKFLSYLSQFIGKLPVEVLANVKDSIVELITTDVINKPSTILTEFTKIFNTHVSNRFNNEALYELVEQLSSAGDAFQLMENVLKSQRFSEELVISGKLSDLSESLLMNHIKEILEFNHNKLFEIIILLLVLEFDNKEKLQVIIVEILSNYKNYEITKKTIALSFDKNGSLDSGAATDINKSILNNLITQQFNGFKFSSINLLKFVNSLVVRFVNSLHFQQLVLIELLNTQNYHIIYGQFWELLNAQDPIIVLFKAFTLIKLGICNKASNFWTKNAKLVSSYSPTTRDLENLPRFLKGLEVTSFFGVTISKFYFLVSDLFKSERYFNEALDFINLSINTESEYDVEEHESHFYFQFQISLELLNFDLIESSLEQIKTEDLKKQAISKLIDKLLETNDLKKLTELKLFNDYYTIDELLHTRATQTTDYIRALYFHKVLYSFRLTYKNQREAMESLYEYIITRNPTQKIKVELYLTILNLLRTMDKNEQWILSTVNPTKKQYKVKLLDELNKEYAMITGSNS